MYIYVYIYIYIYIYTYLYIYIYIYTHIFAAGLLVSRVCAKKVSWSWLSPLRGWGSLTMAFTG